MRCHIAVNFSAGCVLSQLISSMERRADVQDVRLCQSGVLFLHSTTLCHIWEKSLNYSVTCITVCESVYNQGFGFSPYL